MSNRRNGKSILYGLDLSKLEQTAMLALGKAVHDQVENENVLDLYTTMQVLVQKDGLLADLFLHTFPRNLI